MINVLLEHLKHKIRDYLVAQNFQQKMQLTDHDWTQFLQFLMRILRDFHLENTYLSKQQFYDVLLDLSQEESEEDGLCYNLLLDTMDYVVGFHGFIAQEGVFGEFIEQMQAMD